MGCCAVTNLNEGEEYVSKIIRHRQFALNSFAYDELREKIEKIAQSEKKVNAIKNKVIALLVHPLDDEEGSSRQAIFHNKCFTNIIEEIFSQLKKNNFTVNKLMLYLFPYLYHSQMEETNKVLYRIFCEENDGDMCKSNFESTLVEYITNCTSKLTFSIWECCEHDDIKRKLEEMNGSFFTHTNIQSIIDKINFSLYEKLKLNNDDEVTEELFLENFGITNISDFEENTSLFDIVQKQEIVATNMGLKEQILKILAKK